jgi:hypothetical protein
MIHIEIKRGVAEYLATSFGRVPAKHIDEVLSGLLQSPLNAVYLTVSAPSSSGYTYVAKVRFEGAFDSWIVSCDREDVEDLVYRINDAEETISELGD